MATLISRKVQKILDSEGLALHIGSREDDKADFVVTLTLEFVGVGKTLEEAIAEALESYEEDQADDDDADSDEEAGDE